MSRAQPRNLPGRRIARGEGEGRRVVVHGIPASGSEEDIVVIPAQDVRPEPSPGRSVSPELREQPGEEREEVERRSESVSSEEGHSSEGEAGMGSRTRLRYSKFKGDGTKDADDWLGEFESTTIANQEDQLSKQRIFQGVLKGEALNWYQDVPEATRNNWDQLKELFLRTFRESGGQARALGRLSKITMRSTETVRRYGQRVKALIKKLTTDIAPGIQVEWYVAGFPEEMGFQIRQARPATLREAMETAQDYENSAQSLRKSIKRSEKMEKGRSKKYERKGRHRRKFSDSETSSSGTESETSVSETESSDSGIDTALARRMRRSQKERTGKKIVKVKMEDDDSKKFMKSIQESLEAIKVNLADNRKPRRIVPTTRANVWCTRCGGPGHYASECTRGTQKQVHFMDEEGVFYTLPETEDYEEEVNPVFQIQTGYGRGRLPQQLIRTNANPYSGMAGSSQGNYPPSRFPPGCCFLCGSPQHYANSCPHKGPGQGAPLALPCQNCQEYGHGSGECPKPQQVRTIYKHVEVPPRDQIALNYGSNTGIENSGK